ncbi:MurR/RpiR family transcriptional regulator [Lysinibacillus sp. Bpr_S20]|uniref:MurR/RpiR family transcriptional regulator n=1 Tax=Lysinibacillus sp. Bpr_S20 TaxID=2933964 RepID=UPI002012E78D|nr:MurR/RpiR family transcriptional regulator [Lysinibacillus sp. Bpr_S20]MCL1699728.1 MurR/RpiR family transcriptional regulator [Lysinibacillus sp. Bpr_S20]
MDNQTIQQVIQHKYQELSKSQQKVAIFILKNLQTVGVHSAAYVGDKAGVSETTVIRFCYAIGLSGYAELQREITMHLFNDGKASSLQNYLQSKQALFETPRFYEKTMEKDASSILNVAKNINEEDFDRASYLLHTKKKVYIVGNGSSRLAAQWLHFTLNMLRPNVVLLDFETSEIVRALQEIDEDSVVIILSFHRYFKEPIQFAAEIQGKNCEIIGITDSKIAPITQYATITFVNEQQEMSTIDAMPSLISFLNTLIAGMTAQDHDYYENQRIKYDDFQNSFLANRWS